MPGTELHLPSTPLRSDSNRGSCPTTPDLMNLVQVRGPRTWSTSQTVLYIFSSVTPDQGQPCCQRQTRSNIRPVWKDSDSIFSLHDPRYEGDVKNCISVYFHFQTIRSPDPTPALVKPNQLNLKDKTPHKTPGLKTPGLKTPGPKSPGPKSPGHLAPEPKTPGGLKSPSKSMLGASPAKSVKSPMKSSAATPSRAVKTPGDESMTHTYDS